MDVKFEVKKMTKRSVGPGRDRTLAGVNFTERKINQSSQSQSNEKVTGKNISAAQDINIVLLSVSSMLCVCVCECVLGMC